MIFLIFKNCLLGCTAVWNNCRPTFHRYILPPSSGIIIHDDGGRTYLWNVCRQLFYTAVHPRRQFWTSYSPPGELEISHFLYSLHEEATGFCSEQNKYLPHNILSTASRVFATNLVDSRLHGRKNTYLSFAIFWHCVSGCCSLRRFQAFRFTETVVALWNHNKTLSPMVVIKRGQNFTNIAFPLDNE
jgi:hypothetical protein